MRHICYITGAGLTKALEADRTHRVPLMWDFVAVLADHIESPTVLMTLATLEVAEAFEHSRPEWKEMAKKLLKHRPRNLREEYARILRRRPAENIERLLQNAYARRHNNIHADTAIPRFSFAINDVFARVEWSLHMDLLTSYLRDQFSLPGTTHTFINYNYDLVLDRCIEVAADDRWNSVAGYGMSFDDILYTDEAVPHMRQFNGAGAAYSLLTPHRSQREQTSKIQILKPHGSLNWACEYSGNYRYTDRPPLLLLRSDGMIGYYPPFDALQIDATAGGEIAFDAALIIVPPSDTGSENAPSFLSQIENASCNAIATADQVVIIGWSMPNTDKNEVTKLSRALAARRKPPEVIVVNLHADITYFHRVAGLCGLPLDCIRIFNNGFLDFVNASRQNRTTEVR